MKKLNIGTRKNICMLFAILWYMIIPCTIVIGLNCFVVKALYNKFGIIQWSMMFDTDFINGEIFVKIALFCLLYTTPIRGFIEILWEYNDIYKKKKS